eukprot:INCI10678.1.p1 GENE.INCI10678.1~~INCI10678.1.p1  ORF type:complete len:211 (-),score=39.13 INCI10678.1:166-798(-)
MPIVLDDGRFRVLAIHEGPSVASSSGSSNPSASQGNFSRIMKAGVNVSQTVRKACAQWNVSLDMENYEAREDSLVDRVQQVLEDHLGRNVLVEIPLDAPDGRKLVLQVRQGQQHDLQTTVRCFVDAVGLPASSVSQIVAAVEQRLPASAVAIPINVPNRRKVDLKVSASTPGSVKEEVSEFCKWNQLPDSNVPTLVKSALKGINPNAFIL